ncbi:RWD domain-containing protein 3 isoform X2 [Lampetra planeri]
MHPNIACLLKTSSPCSVPCIAIDHILNSSSNLKPTFTIDTIIRKDLQTCLNMKRLQTIALESPDVGWVHRIHPVCVTGNYRTLSSHPWMKASPCPFGRGASLTMLHCAVTNGITLALNICCESRGVRYPLRTLIRLPPGYPTQQHLDVVSLHVDGAASPAALTREQCRTLLHNIRQRAFALPPQPAVHDLASWLQQNFETLLHVGGVTITAEQEQYAKHLCSEAASPGNKDGNISAKDLEEYIVLQKTSKVDVDSSGKRCKEKMMSVLWEGTMSTRQYRFSDFCVLEISSTNELGKVFEEAQLGELYHQCVVPTLP